jgi:hypothetical protein
LIELLAVIAIIAILAAILSPIFARSRAVPTPDYRGFEEGSTDIRLIGNK